MHSHRGQIEARHEKNPVAATNQMRFHQLPLFKALLLQGLRLQMKRPHVPTHRHRDQVATTDTTGARSTGAATWKSWG